jgi:chaperone modulatory protein CbpM
MAAKYEIICISTGAYKDLLSEEDVAYKCSVHPELIGRMRVLGLIEPERDEEPLLYCPCVVTKLKRIIRLRQDLGVSYMAAGIITDLLEKIDELEEKIRKYEKGR